MPDFEWSFPYPSQRMPVLARNVVATSQPLAAQAGLEMLRAGGNAVDAAVATAIALTVTEPTSNGIGSDAFALVWDPADGGALHGLNGSGRSPRGLSASQFAGMERMPFNGWGPVTVPGAVSAWVEASRRFGRLPFETLFAPALRAARDGYLVAPQTAASWGRAPQRWPGMAAFADTFLPGGRPPGPGERVTLPDHARTLEAIAVTGGDAFYEGELADAIERDAKANGGTMTRADLAAHRCEWVAPIEIDYNGLTVHEIPPNGQGLAALLMLGIIRHHPLAELHPDCPDSVHIQIEAMKLAFIDAHRHIADPAHMTTTVSALLDPAHLEAQSRRIDPRRAQDFRHGAPKQGGTVLLTAADAGGMMVTFIQSNYTGFGSGVVIPGTGIAMQNRGACFTLEAGHPNQVGPGKRPYHTIIPAFVTRKGEPLMAFGVMGGAMQPQGHAQVIIRLADHRQNPQAALDAPRWQVTEGLGVQIEPGFPGDVYDVLRERGHDLEVASEQTVLFGGGQAIHRLEDGYFGASDLRRDGQAVGY